MRITIASGGRRRAVDVIATPRAVLADLVAAADAPRTDHVHVDGRRVDTDHGLVEAGLADGALVALDGFGGRRDEVSGRQAATGAGPARGHAPRLVVLTGSDAGVVVPVDGTVVVGSGPAADVVLRGTGLAGAHFSLDAAGDAVRVTPLAGVAHDGVVLDDATAVPLGAVLRAGAVVLQVLGPEPDDRPTGPRVGIAGTPFNRPPRPAGPPAASPVVLPAASAAVTPQQPFPWLAALLPLVLGGVLVATTGSWRFAVFLVLGPVLLAGNWWTQRRRGRREGATQAVDRRATLDRLRRDCAAAVRGERRRRWAAYADVAELVRRAHGPSMRLWERRATDHDALRLVVGVGDVVHDLEVDPRSPAPSEDVRAVLRDASRLAAVPVEVDLRDGGVVGIVGAPDAGRALARALLLQAVVHHGPADLELAVVAAPHRVGDWWWSTWAPHARRGDARGLAVAGAPATALLTALLDGPGDDVRTRLVVVDAVEQLQGRGAPARAVLAGDAGPVAGVVVADRLDQLPAVCTTVVQVDGEDRARIVRGAGAGQSFAPVGCSTATASTAARALARHDDPEAGAVAGPLPRAVGLPDLLDPGWDDARAVADRWARSQAAGDVLDVPLGVGVHGAVRVDLVADGPHGLLGGTTGSGKSELLRTLVAGLAARHGPDRCTFLLVDYKGGAAFDACADLPHVVGLVTDLDEHLAGRALASLDAELRHREERLRAAGVTDLAQWQRLPASAGGEPLPRLVVVVDEFATLKAELPGFVDALVGVAQRGRSLGVHLLLGTQRPAGAVSDDVRANSALRVALRVTDARDAVDVVGTPDAAHIPLDLPGRGLLKRGPAAPSPLQTALATGCSATRPAVVLRPVRFDAGPTTPGAEPVPDDGPTDLERLVAACRAAAGDARAPRAPWLPPLPERLPLGDLAQREGSDRAGALAIGLLDVPEAQQQVPAGWDPRAGTLLVHGTVGSGTTTTLAAVVLAAARRWSPDDCHVQVLDLGRGHLAPLVALAHVGSVVAAREEERRARLLAELVAEGDRRRALDAVALDDEPLLLVVVDHLDALLDELDGRSAYELEAALLRLLADAPGLRVAVAASTGRPGGLRPAVVATAADRWGHRLADRADLGLLGVRADDVPDLVPGRCVRSSDGHLLQVADPGDLGTAAARLAGVWPAPTRLPHVVRVLPEQVPVEVVRARARLGDGVWSLVVGLGDRDLAPAGPVLRRGQHAVVLGPSGSGRSTALAAMAASARGQDGEGTGVEDAPVLLAVAGSTRSSLHDVPVDRHVAPDGLGEVLRALVAGERDALVLVDDADRVPDPGPVLQDLAADRVRVHLVVAARIDAVQADYGHWVRRLARARTGLVLGPPDGGGFELLQARSPRAAGRRVPGRGWLVGDDVEPVQVAAPVIHRTGDRARTSGRRSA